MIDLRSIDERLTQRIRLPMTTRGPIWLALSASLRRAVSAESLMAEVVDFVTQELEADRGTLYLYDRDDDALVSAAAHLPELRELRVPVSHGVAGFVAREREVVNFPARSLSAKVWKAVDDSTGYETRSMLVAPLECAGEFIGVLQILNGQNPIFDSESEAKFVGLAAEISEILGSTTLPASAARSSVSVEGNFNGIVGIGPEMKGVLSTVSKVASTDATVLIRGESGTGKGLVAKAIHENSPRAEGPFVTVDCAALPAGLIEDALFGHVRGAYTGADKNVDGLIASACSGTMFLDEIGELPLAVQAKLLRVLQEKVFLPIGGTETLDADVRVVAATHRNLEEMIEAGTFRADLFYRLNVIQIVVPALRERTHADRVALVHHFVQMYAKRHGKRVEGIDPAAMEFLTHHSWPGNVRELQHAIESAVIMSDGFIERSLFGVARSDSISRSSSLAEAESRHIAAVLASVGGNKSACARALGIGRTTLHRKLSEYDIRYEEDDN